MVPKVLTSEVCRFAEVPPELQQRGYASVRILGLDFFQGSAAEAVEVMQRDGGLLVIPAAPALKDLGSSMPYREALLGADLAITDSAFMVLIWNRIAKPAISRLSGLEYLRMLLARTEVRAPGSTLWIMASAGSARKNLDWLHGAGIVVPDEYVYLAPMYAAEIHDASLLEAIERLRPQNIVLTLGGGTQERLGFYLKQRLSYRPAIHCIGAAIAFLSGDQVYIPEFADKLYMGWLIRVVSEPRKFVPRYWEARKLFALMVRWRDRLPNS